MTLHGRNFVKNERYFDASPKENVDNNHSDRAGHYGNQGYGVLGHVNLCIYCGTGCIRWSGDIQLSGMLLIQYDLHATRP